MKLTDTLLKLYNSDEYPLHMPGHKRNDMGILSDAYHLDITEIEEYDNLYDAEGILKEAMERAAKLYNCPNTFYLVNGSTTGILTAIASVCNLGDEIIIASNSHRSVHSIIELLGLTPNYISIGSLLSKDISGAVIPNNLQTLIKEGVEAGKSFCAVVITSPNYDGIISDIQAIADICHSHNIPLIVDEAHGAHLGLYKNPKEELLPKGALSYGADIVIHSTHKTLAAMTQTALLHIQGDLVDITRIKKYWHTFQTSSPSYVLMSSIDEAVCQLMENGTRLWQQFFQNRKKFDIECKELQHLHILNNNDINKEPYIKALDPCKITVITNKTPIDGFTLQRILLDEYKIQIELATDERIICIVTYADIGDGFKRLSNALIEIDNKLGQGAYLEYNGATQASEAKKQNKSLYAPCIPKI